MWLSVINQDVYPKPRLTRIFRLREREKKRVSKVQERKQMRRKKHNILTELNFSNTAFGSR